MRGFLATLLGIVALLFVNTGEVTAQGVIQQSGPATAFHGPAWFSNGVLGDAGTPQTPYLSALGLFGGTNCPLGVSSQTGPGSSLTPYSLFTVCQTAGATTFTFTGLNGQATPSVYFNIGGTLYPFPGNSGGVAGPVSSINGDLACWNGTTGSALSDCGIASIIGANTLLGNATGSSAVPTPLAVPNCNASNSALNWTAATGFSCRSISGGGGGLTSVATGPGLTGGPCTTSCTVSATASVNAQTGSSYTVLAGDSAGIVTLSNGSAIAVTIPAPTGSFAAGFATTICDTGAGTATLTPTGSTIGGASTYTLTTGNCVSPVSDGSNYQVVPYTGQTGAAITSLTATGTLRMGSGSALLCSATAPTVTSAGASPSVVDNNGTCSFTVNVGTGGTASAVVLSLPTAAHGWTCAGGDVTTQSTSVFFQKQTASSTTAATITNYNTAGAATAFVASDQVRLSCHAD